ncbi:MAG: ABC transporter permease [bacterium]
MGYIVKMALRNIGRNKRRTIISLLAIAIGVTFVIFGRGYIEGMVATFIENIIRFSSGHIRIVNREYQAKERILPLVYPVDGFSGEGYETMAREAERVPGVQMATGRIRFRLLLAKGERTEPGLGVAVQPALEDRLSSISRYIGEGRFIHPGEREIVVGHLLMKKMGLSVGDSVTVVVSSSLNSLRGMTFRIVGSIESGLALLDKSSLYMPIDLAQRMLEMEDRVTELIVLCRDQRQTSAILKRLRESFDSREGGERYELRPWYSLNELIIYMGVARRIYTIIYMVILFLACFVMMNTMIMVVNERTREIGMMRALGLKGWEVLSLLLLEGSILGVFGSATGLVIGGGVLYLLSITGIDMSQAISAVGEEFLFFPTIYPLFSPGNLLFGFSLGVAISALTALLPACRATRLEPTEALRYI